MDYNFDIFLEGLSAYSIEISCEQLNMLARYYEMLVEKNKVMNLTAITEFDEVMVKHFLDSLALIQVVNLNQPMSVMDLGTGAGFPGIPLKIVFPMLKMTLTDSLNKRILFLRDVIESLGLNEIEAVHGRAEDLARMGKYRESFDLTVSRAVANLATLCEYCLPFVKCGGKFVSYKSSECQNETHEAENAISLLGGEISEIRRFDLKGAGRAFIVIDKLRPTPKKYPRKAGTPAKEPL